MPPTSINPAALVVRAVGFASTDNIDCPRFKPNEHGDSLFGEGSITLHQLMVYVSAPCLLITVASSPDSTIINLPIAYCLFNFLALTSTMDYMYIEPIGAIYEAFTVPALFFLVLEWVCPDGTDREKYFDNLELHSGRGKVLPGGSLKWFQRTWTSVLQYPLLKSILIIIQIITQYFGDFCESSFSPKHAHLYLTLADWLFVGGALGATIRFSARVRPDVAPIHKPRAKIYSFIGIILFQLIQNLLFHLLNGKLFSPTKTATYNDINFGIASFMSCIEAVIFSLIFQWSFSSSEYKEGQKLDRLGSGPAQRTKTFRAIFDALNLSDIVAGTILAFQLLFMRVQSRYGGRGPPQRQRTLRVEDQVHLEPLTDRRNVRAHDPDMPVEMESETQYAEGYSPPPLPPTARDPSPGAPHGKAQTWRADGLRPELGRQDSYSRRGYARGNSPESQPLQQPRPYV